MCVCVVGGDGLWAVGGFGFRTVEWKRIRAQIVV